MPSSIRTKSDTPPGSKKIPVRRRHRRAATAAGPLSSVLAPVVTALDSMVKTGVRRDPFQRDPELIGQVFPMLNVLQQYFAVQFRGWERVPKGTPCLIVGNHSGGAETTDFWLLLYKWVKERGPEAPLYGLAYNLLFGTPVLGPTMHRLGIVPASHANARRAFARGAAVAVFPGGDYEVFRSWSERNRIDFGGHTGFITLAIRTGVPVVPMTIHGAHQSTLVLTRGAGLAHAAGIDRLHVKVFPFIFSIPFGPAPAFVPSIQLPSKVTVHFDSPLDWSRYGIERARDPIVLQTCYDEITAMMQKTLSRLARETPYPVVARMRELGLPTTLNLIERIVPDQRAEVGPRRELTPARRGARGADHA